MPMNCSVGAYPNVPADVDETVDSERRAALAQRPSLDVLLDEDEAVAVGSFEGIDVAWDVGVIEHRENPRLALEEFESFPVLEAIDPQPLDDDHTRVSFTSREERLAEPAFPELALDRVGISCTDKLSLCGHADIRSRSNALIFLRLEVPPGVGSV